MRGRLRVDGTGNCFPPRPILFMVIIGRKPLIIGDFAETSRKLGTAERDGTFVRVKPSEYIFLHMNVVGSMEGACS